MHPTLAITVTLLLAAAVPLACTSKPAPPPMQDYTLVYLTTGPAKPTAEESKTIFQGHMANIQRLADEHQLLVAGPFDKPANPAWRGIFVFDVPTVKAADALVATDPGIQSGVFAHEAHTLSASTRLRQVPDFERELNAAKGAPESKDPGANIRAYVMLTAEDPAQFKPALTKAHLKDKIIWWGEVDRGARAVFVLDVKDAAEVHTALSAPGIDAGAFVADGWWSSTSLERLKGTPDL